MSDRKLATIRKIDEVNPIEGADAIEAVTVGGWKVVVKKDEFKVGDLAVYLEVDSWCPHTLAPFLSRGNEPREFEGIKGERLRTIRLRGQISQGLLLPLSIFSDYPLSVNLAEGSDCTELLGILKYEKPLPAQLAGVAKGNFPGFIRKTDQERCLSGDTIVQTNLGAITIKEIVDSKLQLKVESFNHNINQIEYKPIIDWSVMTRKQIWKKITLKSGKVLIATHNHKIWCDDLNAYREIKDIEIGQKFITKTE